MKSLILITIISFSIFNYTFATQILSKSKLEKCEKVSDSQGLNCTSKIILDLAVPSESVHKNYFVFFDLYIFLKSFSLWQSGREASMVAEIVEAEENSTNMRTLRVPPVITINKSAAYALYELTYIRVSQSYQFLLGSNLGCNFFLSFQFQCSSLYVRNFILFFSVGVSGNFVDANILSVRCFLLALLLNIFFEKFPQGIRK